MKVQLANKNVRPSTANKVLSSKKPTISQDSLPSNLTDQVSLGSAGEKRVNWADVKELAGLAVNGAALGATPVVGASLGAFELATNVGNAEPSSIARGSLNFALNAIGTASLVAGFLPGVAIGLGGAALMGAGTLVADNLHGRTLTTTTPKPEPEVQAKETKPLTALRLAKTTFSGAVGAAFGAVPVFGLLMGLNAANYQVNNESTPTRPLVAATTLARIGGAVASIGTGNPLPYMAAVGLNAAVLGVDNAILNYRDS